jgi:hypothetical protein
MPEKADVVIQPWGSTQPWASGIASQMPKNWDDFAKRCAGFKDGKGTRFMPYTSITTTCRGMEQYQAYKGEWDPASFLPLETQPGREAPADWAGTNPWNYDEISCLVTKSNIDFRMWVLDEMLKRNVQGVYEDNVKLMAVYKPEAGFGYVRDDGCEQPAFNLFELREYHKRQAVLFAQYGLAHPHTVIHMTRKCVVPTLSFTDCTYDGEWRNVYAPQVDFVDLWDLGTIRSEGLGRQYGFVPTWHVMIRGKNMSMPELTRGTLSVLGPNDVMLVGGYHNPQERAKYQKVVNDFGTGAPDCVFYPYWEDGSPIRSSAESIASAYVRPGKMLLVVANRAEEPREVKVQVDFKKLGLAPAAEAGDMQTGEKFAVRDGAVAAPIPRHDYRLLLLPSAAQ